MYSSKHFEKKRAEQKSLMYFENEEIYHFLLRKLAKLLKYPTSVTLRNRAAARGRGDNATTKILFEHTSLF